MKKDAWERTNATEDAGVSVSAPPKLTHAAPTKGPWRVGEMGGNSGDAESLSVRDDKDFVVADVWLDTERLAVEGPANAHLIAAAPEMYAALQRVSDQAHHNPDSWLNIVDAAIAKAEGK